MKILEETSFISSVRVESEETVLVEVEEIEIQEAKRLIRENSPAKVLSVTLVPLNLNQVFLRLVRGSDS